VARARAEGGLQPARGVGAGVGDVVDGDALARQALGARHLQAMFFFLLNTKHAFPFSFDLIKQEELCVKIASAQSPQ